MVEKIMDGASMVWQTLDSRERMILLYVVGVGCYFVADLARRQQRDRTEERIARRAAQIVRQGG